VHTAGVQPGQIKLGQSDAGQDRRSAMRTLDFSLKHITRHGDFEVATTPALQGGGYLAWAKMGKIMGDNPITEPGNPVWMVHGRTREEARAKVLAELGLVA
jgi:hypothetical protein